MLQNISLDPKSMSTDTTSLTLNTQPASEQGQNFSELLNGQELSKNGLTKDNQVLSVAPVETSEPLLLEKMGQVKELLYSEITTQNMTLKEVVTEGVATQDEVVTTEAIKPTAEMENIDVQIQQLLASSEINLTEAKVKLAQINTTEIVSGNNLPLTIEAEELKTQVLASQGLTLDSEKALKQNKGSTLETMFLQNQKVKETVKDARQDINLKIATPVDQKALLINTQNNDGQNIAQLTPVIPTAVNLKKQTAKLDVNSLTSIEKMLPSNPSSETDSLKLEVVMDSKKSIDVSRFEKAFTHRIQTMVQQGRQVAEMRLDPPQLGKVEVNLQTQHNTITVAIAVDNAQIKQLVEQSVSRLQDALSNDQGTQVDVNVSSDRSAQDEQSESSAENNYATPAELQAEEQIAPKKVFVNMDSLVDVYG